MKAIVQATILLGTAAWHTTAVAQPIDTKQPDIPEATAVNAQVVPSELPPLGESLQGEAKVEYEAATTLFNDGDYTGCLTKLAAAYRLSAEPRLLWNMAAAEKHLRHYSKVIEHTERFLTAGPPHTTADDVAQAKRLLAAMRGFVSSVTLDVRPEGVNVKVDGQSVGKTPLPEAISLDFGRHEVQLSKDGYRSETRRLELEGGKPASLVAVLTEESHQGTLMIMSDSDTTLRVDGVVVGIGLWQSVVQSGAHTVQLEGKNKRPQTLAVHVSDGETRTLSVHLNDLDPQVHIPTWVWIAGGAAVVGLGVGTYFLVRPSNDPPAIQKGSWGTLEF